jgi:Holliday junction resolvase RusA-like endonuclease
MDFKMNFIPPSTNALYGYSKRRVFIKPVYRTFKTNMDKILNNVIPSDYKPIESNVNLYVTFYIKGKRKRDLDNMLKALCDSLQPRLIKDDNQIVEIHCKKIRSDIDQTFVSLTED